MSRPAAVALCLAAILGLTGRGYAEPTADAAPAELVQHALQLLSPSSEARQAALDWFVARGNVDAAPAIIQALRFVRARRYRYGDALRALTGANVASNHWQDWMVWQEGHPEVEPFEGFVRFKTQVFAGIDPAFRRFVYPGVAHEIRLEEIVWGGVRVGGIPALTNPDLIPAADAAYLRDEDLVFGVALNGDVRAYPLRIMNWHEMLNDVIGGEPVSLAYCTLCGSGILYRTQVPGRDAPFTFDSSGLLYRSNKLMFDRQTDSLWNQFTGRPVTGKLTGSGIELDLLPVTITTWAKWRAAQPETRVLSLDTGVERDYSPGAAYAAYFASPDLMFPTRTDDARLPPKAFVFGVRLVEGTKAWPVAAFARQRVLHDRLGDRRLVLVGDAASRTVAAYEAGGHDFAAGATSGTLMADGTEWRIESDALVGPNGERLARLPGHVAYWFAWSGYFPDTALFTGE